MRRIKLKKPHNISGGGTKPNYRAIKKQYRTDYAHLRRRIRDNRRYKAAKANLVREAARRYESSNAGYDDNIAIDSAFAIARFGRAAPVLLRRPGSIRSSSGSIAI